MTEATAKQMAEGGWNLVWCTEKELDVAHRFGLRAQLQDGLLLRGIELQALVLGVFEESPEEHVIGEPFVPRNQVIERH